MLYNAAKNHSTQRVEGQRYDLLKPVSCFKMTNTKTLSDYNDDIELIFIELPKFNKDLE